MKLSLRQKLVENKNGKCLCGCGLSTSSSKQSDAKLGLIKGTPRQYIVGHNGRWKGPLWEVLPNGCWKFLGKGRSDGYALWHRDGKGIRAHRFVYEKIKGKIPEGLTLDHLCRNRECVNPTHLEPVTQAENNRRGKLAKLNIASVVRIKEMLKNGISPLFISKEFKVARRTISSIKIGSSWKDVK